MKEGTQYEGVKTGRKFVCVRIIRRCVCVWVDRNENGVPVPSLYRTGRTKKYTSLLRIYYFV